MPCTKIEPSTHSIAEPAIKAVLLGPPHSKLKFTRAQMHKLLLLCTAFHSANYHYQQLILKLLRKET
jgi:hypothetical protein